MEVMADMDMLLLTSRVEGFPNVLVEAQLVGVPVISTRVGGASEAVDHGRSGWLLDDDDPAKAADIIIRLLRDVEWRQTASNRGREFAKACFGMPAIVELVDAIYNYPLSSEVAKNTASMVPPSRCDQQMCD
jgi:glycosyltransferase involved in cell wall biosynthesis